MGRLPSILALFFCPLLALRAEPLSVRGSFPGVGEDPIRKESLSGQSPSLRPLAGPRVLAALERWRARGFEARAEFAPGNARPRAVTGFRWTSGAPLAAVAETARAFLGAEPDLVGIGLPDLGAPAVLSGPNHFSVRF